jgi:Deoxyribonuclease II
MTKGLAVVQVRVGRSLVVLLLLLSILFVGRLTNGHSATTSPAPLLKRGQPVDWWFVFKFNSAVFPGCGGNATRHCLFGGEVQPYRQFGQQFVYASSDDPSLKQGSDCTGDTVSDPVGATFDEIYNGSFYYIVWNDQFYDDPQIAGCSKSCGSPWGHSKGLLAWNDDGEGMVLQVTTPSWPGAGSKRFPRTSDGNTLGCTADDNVEASQHFFAVRLSEGDLISVLTALQNASVVTDTSQPQIVRSGGPKDVQQLVQQLGVRSQSDSPTKVRLSTGVQLISKPSALHVPPWQLVSAELDGTSLRTATWWTTPKIPSTTSSSSVGCWNASLGTPGPVTIAITGQWSGKPFGLTGGVGGAYNHAKIGVSTSGSHNYSIFGDMNQQGSLSQPKCSSSQNGRGGLFYVIDNTKLSDALKNLLKGDSSPPNGRQ